MAFNRLGFLGNTRSGRKFTRSHIPRLRTTTRFPMRATVNLQYDSFMSTPDPKKHSLSAFFLSGYLQNLTDEENFPSGTGGAVFDRYELVFGKALQVLEMTKESLRSKEEFNFDSGDASKLEAGIATLRVVNALHVMGHTKITLISTPKGTGGADITSEKAGKTICFEVKALTKQSTGGDGKFFEQQLYDKVFDLIGKAKNQLLLSTAQLKCDLQIVVFVVNWFSQSIYLVESDYFDVVKRLATEQDHSQLTGINGILFVTSAGTQFLFLEEAAKSIDC